ncbi:Retrovirus-related Pol polyprotein, partial [Mucuna pruriens]
MGVGICFGVNIWYRDGIWTVVGTRYGVGIRFGVSMRISPNTKSAFRFGSTRVGILTVDDRVDITESTSSGWDAFGLYWDDFILIKMEPYKGYKICTIIYPILDSQWVSPVQVVPKKFRMTVMKNRHDEMVPARIHNSWRFCIDYRKLNQVTHKDIFPLPFIDHVLEKLAKKSHYCFLDGFSGRWISIRQPLRVHSVRSCILGCRLDYATP